MEIRLASIGELEKWWNDRIRLEPNAKQHKYFKDKFISQNKSGGYHTFFVWQSGEYIGQATLIFDGKRAEVNRLELVPEYRGKGIATQILEHLEKHARQKGIDTLLIGVEPSEIRNMQIYFHWGFTEFVRIDSNKIEGIETNEYLVYSKKL